MSAGAAPRQLHFALPVDLHAVMQQVRGIEAFLRDAGCSERSARQFAMAAEEILVNILHAAWPGQEPGRCTVDVTAIAGPGVVQVSLRADDDGVAFDPTQAAPPDLDAPLEEREVGGLGLLLVRSMTDMQSYRRIDGHNVFEVRKACPAA